MAGERNNKEGRCLTLVLSRKVAERIIINGNITITVLTIRGNQVRLGIEAPTDVKVIREELQSAPALRESEQPHGKN